MDSERVAGRYRLLRELGHGGGGSVWLARDERLSRDVALKRIHAIPGESSLEAARAQREAQVAARVQHKNVVAVYDVLDEDGVPWLVLEYVPGSSLEDMVATRGAMPPRDVATIGAQVASAMAQAHAVDVMHRDIKPANILVADGMVAKLTDFGIARAKQDVRLTAQGLMTGTALYFSPELADGEDPSPASDVWALGATLYYAVEGRTPVEQATSPLATLRRISDAPRPQPQNAGPLTGVLVRMLDPDPDTRIDMATAAKELAAVAAARPASGAGAPTERIPSKARKAGPTGLLPVANVEPAEPEGRAVVPPPPESTSAAEHDSRRRGLVPMLAAALALLLLVLGAVVLSTLGDEDTPAADPPVDTTSVAPTGSPVTTEPTAPATSPTSTTAATSTTTTSSTPAPVPQPEPVVPSTTTPTPTPPPTTPSPTTTREPADEGRLSAAQLSAFPGLYVSAAAADPEAGWNLLSPGMQARNPGGHRGYVKYWGSIASARTVSVEPDVAGQRVDVVYRTTLNDGDIEEITATWYLVPGSDGPKLNRYVTIGHRYV